MAELTGVWEKVYQAGRHVNELETTLQGIYNFAAETIRLVEDTETGDYFAILPAVPDLPPRLAAVFGDICHNLRSALDHLAYQLVLFPAVPPNEPKRAEDRVSFPLYASESHYSDWGIHGTDERAKAVIKFLQPFGDKRHVLWLLHELDNRDKHRLLLVVAHEMTPGVLDESIFETLWVRKPGPAVNNAQLARFRLAPGVEADMDVGLYISFGIKFADGPAAGIDAWRFVKDAERAVCGIIGSLVPFLAETA